jgi:plastocyanin
MYNHATVMTLIATACVAGCGGSGGGHSAASSPAISAQPKVDIHSFEFTPPAVVVRRGGEITWTNSDAAAHTATADDRSFDTQTINHGKSRSVVFKTAGTFRYHCDFHPFMKATVVVR